jgi:membrane protease YdiL (CAAX protease family)
MFLNGKNLSKRFYVLGLLAIFVCVYSQYLVSLGKVLGFIVVYGIPVLIVGVIFGREILRRASRNGGTALKLGLGFFGAFAIAGIFLAIAALIVILAFYPQTLNLLDKPNPVLQVPPDLAWVMTAASLLVVGPAEEFLFRGFVYGGLLNIFKGRHWLILALLSSFVFASVHLYYVVTYGVASAIPLIELITFGMAMAMTYYVSGGNLIVPAVIHGVYDATAFAGIATSMTVGLTLRVILITIGVVFAAIYVRRKTLQT